jgi:hypothetical protein
MIVMLAVRIFPLSFLRFIFVFTKVPALVRILIGYLFAEDVVGLRYSVALKIVEVLRSKSGHSELISVIYGQVEEQIAFPLLWPNRLEIRGVVLQLCDEGFLTVSELTDDFDLWITLKGDRQPKRELFESHVEHGLGSCAEV